MQCNLVDRFFKVVNLINDEQKVPKDYGTGHLLYHSEMGLMEAIHNNPDINASELSKVIKVTKGAVTQVAVKLTTKGLIESHSIKGNKKEKYFKLTEDGEKVRLAHQKYHEDANQRLCNYFSSLKKDEAETVFHFLETITDCIPICSFTCTCSMHEEAKKKRGCKNE